MEKINPVVMIFGGFMTVFAATGVWTFLASLLTRKSDVKLKDTSALTSLEKESREFREEVRQDKAEVKAELEAVKKETREMKEAFIPLIDTLDDLLPKMVQCLTEDERLLLRDRVNAAKMKT